MAVPWMVPAAGPVATGVAVGAAASGKRLALGLQPKSRQSELSKGKTVYEGK